MSITHGHQFENPSKLFLWFYGLFSSIITRSAYKKLIKALNLNGNERILEFGSGVGSLGKKLALELQNKGELVCIDVSDKFLDQTKQKLKKFNNVKFILGEISTTDIPDSSFDYIVATWVLHHVKDDKLEPSIDKFRSILKQNGKIFIIEFPDSHQKRSDFTQERLLRIFKKHGFESKTIFEEKRGILYEFKKAA